MTKTLLRLSEVEVRVGSISSEVFKYWEDAKLMEAEVFQNSKFCSKAWMLSLSRNSSQVSPVKQAHFVHFFQNVCQLCTQVWITRVGLPVILSTGVPWIKQQGQLSFQIEQVLFLKTAIILWYAAEVLYMYFPFNIKNMCTQGMKFYKINNFHCFIKNVLQQNFFFFFPASAWWWRC